MRVIIDVPEKFLVVAAGLISAGIDDSEEIVNNAVENCKGKDIEVDIKDTNISKGDLIQWNVGMATLAITKALDEIRNEELKGDEKDET